MSSDDIGKSAPAICMHTAAAAGFLASVGMARHFMWPPAINASLTLCIGNCFFMLWFNARCSTGSIPNERFFTQIKIKRWALPAVHELQIDFLAVDPHHLPGFAAGSAFGSEVCTGNIASAARGPHRTWIVVP